ncbi:Hypothetical predicted protein [Lecanosticta acicola]|uniref:DUF7626 domain-containing protein n=1 Tax=Lecanosticta acicola TaxID=111012 RepID=A0AAI9EFJ4_9PEZI|nr:Hypothetical predicted protein [Lecanosticta acicola]
MDARTRAGKRKAEAEPTATVDVADRDDSGSQSSSSNSSQAIATSRRLRSQQSKESDDEDEDPIRRPTKRRKTVRSADETSSDSSSSDRESPESDEDELSGTVNLDRRTRKVRQQKRRAANRFRNVPEGAGHTYTFDLSNQDRVRWIGTTECYTCVGTYFAISKERCFIGHWNYELTHRSLAQRVKSNRRNKSAQTDPEGTRCGARDPNEYAVDDDAFNFIRRNVKDRLNEWQFLSSWGPITNLMRDSLIMICPEGNKDTGSRYVGDAVVAGIQEWLGMRTLDPQPQGQYQSFVVWHDGSTRPPRKLFQGGNPARRGDAWRRYNQSVNGKCEHQAVRGDGKSLTHALLDPDASAGESEVDTTAQCRRWDVWQLQLSLPLETSSLESLSVSGGGGGANWGVGFRSCLLCGPITIDYDSDDARLIELKQQDHTDALLAETLAKEGRMRFSAVDCRYERLDDELSGWHAGEDDKLKEIFDSLEQKLKESLAEMEQTGHRSFMT